MLRGLLPDRATRWLDLLERNPIIVLAGFALIVGLAGPLLGKPIIAITNGLRAVFDVPPAAFFSALVG